MHHQRSTYYNLRLRFPVLCHRNHYLSQDPRRHTFFPTRCILSAPGSINTEGRKDKAHTMSLARRRSRLPPKRNKSSGSNFFNALPKRPLRPGSVEKSGNDSISTILLSVDDDAILSSFYSEVSGNESDDSSKHDPSSPKSTLEIAVMISKLKKDSNSCRWSNEKKENKTNATTLDKDLPSRPVRRATVRNFGNENISTSIRSFSDDTVLSAGDSINTGEIEEKIPIMSPNTDRLLIARRRSRIPPKRNKSSGSNIFDGLPRSKQDRKSGRWSNEKREKNSATGEPGAEFPPCPIRQMTLKKLGSESSL